MGSSATLNMASLIKVTPVSSSNCNFNGEINYGFHVKGTKSLTKLTKLSAFSPNGSVSRSCSNGNRFEPLVTTPAGGSSQRPGSTMEDSNSPFYLHSGDNPGLTLVSHPLNGTNYNTWSRSILMALNAKNKVGFVDGTLQRPTSDDLTYSFWSRCNSMVTSWLLNSVAKEIADSLLYLESARDVWNDLYERFHQSNAPRIFQIKMLLLGLSQGSLDVSNYYTKLKILWDELKDYQPVPVCSCGGMKKWMEYQQQEYVMQFLMGLNDSFASIRAQILMMDPLPSISKTFSLVVQEERQRTIGAEIAVTPESMVFQSSAPASSSPMTNAVAASSRYKARGNRPVCTHCGLMGHTVDKCYKLHGYPPGFKPKLRSGPSGATGQQNSIQSNFAHQVFVEKPPPGFPSPQAQGMPGFPSPQAQGLIQPSSSFTPNECQRLIALLSSQLHLNTSSQPEAHKPDVPSASHFTGCEFSGRCA